MNAPSVKDLRVSGTSPDFKIHRFLQEDEAPADEARFDCRRIVPTARLDHVRQLGHDRFATRSYPCRGSKWQNHSLAAGYKLKKKLVAHIGHSSQLVSDANDRNAQFLPTVASSVRVAKVEGRANLQLALQADRERAY